jgi:hypothetical protein
MEPAIDIYANLSLILDSIQSLNYNNEHEFQTHLYKTVQAVPDSHFRFSPDLLIKALFFRRLTEIVSVSRDGVKIPKAYTKVNNFHWLRKSNNNRFSRGHHCV